MHHARLIARPGKAITIVTGIDFIPRPHGHAVDRTGNLEHHIFVPDWGNMHNGLAGNLCNQQAAITKNHRRFGKRQIICQNSGCLCQFSLLKPRPRWPSGTKTTSNFFGAHLHSRKDK
jgi:hypothetical protein